MDNPRLEINQRDGKQSYASIERVEQEQRQGPFKKIFKFLDSDKRLVFQEASRTHSTIQLFLCSILFMFIVLFGAHSFIASNVFQTDSITVNTHETWVDLIKDLPSSQSIHEFFEHYASYSQLAGTRTDLKLAKWTRDQFSDFGLQNATLKTYYPYLNYPIRRELSIITGPQELLFQADLDGPTDTAPAFHAYSASGNVTGPVVYVNYGRLEDFVALSTTKSIALNGTIALMRHGVIPASVKVQHAEAFGCIGVLLYTDPAETLHHKGNNKFGPGHIKRESVQYSLLYPGDPFTPGVAVVNATRNATDNTASNLPTIPSLPIAWSHALPLLRATQGYGVVVDPSWIGGFNEVSYYSGPSAALCNLVNLNEFAIKPIWNVLAHIEGHEEKEKAIIIGNHRDAWDNGSADPSSGASVMLEVARVLGMLVQNGWKPRRTIVFASWDANEYGNIGSTEYVEANLPWLDKNAIAYLNIDHAVTGSQFAAQASPLLRRVLYQVASTIINPRTSESVYDTWLDQSKKKHFIVKTEQDDAFTPPVLPVGSTPGLDTTAFFQHAGISSLSMAFTNGDYGVSQSTFDSVSWMEEYGDPTFEYHQTMVRLWGLLAYRLSSDVVLPMNPVDYALVMKQQVDPNVTNINATQALTSAIHTLYKTALKFDKKAQHLVRENDFQTAGKKKKHRKFMKKVNRVNERLVKFERAFVQTESLLLDRPWYKHAIYGPSAKTGLIEVFPSLQEIPVNSTNNNPLVDVLKNAQKILAKGKFHRLDDVVVAAF